jgi:hypothetical protein
VGEWNVITPRQEEGYYAFSAFYRKKEGRGTVDVEERK